MTIEELGAVGAAALIETGVEGGYDAVTCSTAGDYPSLGAQQVEGGRADELLNSIAGGEVYVGRAYSDIEAAGELEALSALLDSPEGQAAQLAIIRRDTERYAQNAIDAGLTDRKCVLYAIVWSPTSELCVNRFIAKRLARGYDIAADLDNLNDAFRNEYADAVGCGAYSTGYRNRADRTYEYINALDLSAYDNE